MNGSSESRRKVRQVVVKHRARNTLAETMAEEPSRTGMQRRVFLKSLDGVGDLRSKRERKDV